MSNTEKQDVYARITSMIIVSLEQGVRPSIQPWNAEHTAGKITRPLRHNGQAYSGINVLMLWASAMEQGLAAPIWMTFKATAPKHPRRAPPEALVQRPELTRRLINLIANRADCLCLLRTGCRQGAHNRYPANEKNWTLESGAR